jgi:glycosyltransferase involved in cell wall biosynthesis
MKIAFIAQSEIFRDPRVLKEAISAKNAGYNVTVLCFGTAIDTSENYQGIEIRRIPNKIQQAYRKILKKYLQKKKSDNQEEPHAEIIPVAKDSPSTSFFIPFCFAFLMYVISNFFYFFIARKVRADLYHIADLNMLLTGVIFKKRYNAKLMYDSHELWIESLETGSKTLKKLLTQYENFLIHFANSVITVNESIAEELSVQYNIAKPDVIYNCPFFEEPVVNLQEDEVKAIYQGRYQVGRGLEETIRAAQYVKGHMFMRGIDDIPGKPYLNQLQKIVVDNDLQPKIEFIDPVPMIELVKSLEGYDIGIVPYKPVNLNNYYATPNKIFEYLMAGMAIVGSDIPELRRIIIGENVGTVFDPDKPEDIARAINWIITEPGLLKMMKDNALRCSRETYNWEIQGTRLLGIYRRLLPEL